MTKALEKAQARVDRMKAQLRKLRAEKRRQDKAARLKADAHLGAIVRAQHPELAKIGV